MKSRQSISSSGYFLFATFSLLVTKISEIDHSNKIKINRNSRPKKNQYVKNKFRIVTLNSFGICVLTNLSLFQNMLLIWKRHMKAYLKLLYCKYFIIYWAFVVIHKFLPKLCLELYLSSCFFKWQFCFKTCHTSVWKLI